MTALSQATLADLGPSISVPIYDRGNLLAGIVHFGVGNFHRVHLAVYVDRLLAKSGAEGWGICGVELIDSPANQAKAKAYEAQDCLYTVTQSAPDGTRDVRVVGAMIEYLHAPADPERVLARLASRATRIVSLTITEGGYNLSERTGEFDLSDPSAVADLAGGTPSSAFGYIVEGLSRRRQAGLRAFTVMSCDNLRHNGDTARTAVVSFARAREPELADWIEANVAFPNSMVDRIAPQVPEQARRRLNTQSGIDDAMPALCEDFMQFVLEDAFSDGRPDLDEVGVELRDDVSTFEVMKQRILNASHMMLGYPGLLCGHRVVHEAMEDARFVALLDSFVENDVIPHLQAPEGVSLRAYKAKVLERFANPAVADQLQRLALDAWAKFPVYHSAILANLLRTDADVRREAFFLACIERYFGGLDDMGGTFLVQEPHITDQDWEIIRNGNSAAFLRRSPFAKLGLAEHSRFREAFERYRALIASKGCRATLDDLLAETRAGGSTASS